MDLVLAAGTGKEFKVKAMETSTAGMLQVEFPSVQEMDAFRKKLTDRALKYFEFLDNTGGVMGKAENYTFTGNVQYTAGSSSDGGSIYAAAFALRKKTDTEIRLDALEAGQEEIKTGQGLQNGAAEELAGITGGNSDGI